jgi:adenylate cyclase, class 2
MESEIEAKFINVDHDDIRKKLEMINGICEQPMRLMRRAIFHNDFMTEKDAYLRVRDEGDKITMTYKQFDDPSSIHGVKEIETTVGNFDSAITMMEQTGLSRDTYQETKRETWKVGEVEVVLDEWPWINPFIEIEGPSESAVRDIAEKLGFDWNDAVFGGVSAVYLRHYTHLATDKDAAIIINRKIPVMRFDDPIPEIITNGMK